MNNAIKLSSSPVVVDGEFERFANEMFASHIFGEVSWRVSHIPTFRRSFIATETRFIVYCAWPRWIRARREASMRNQSFPRIGDDAAKVSERVHLVHFYRKNIFQRRRDENAFPFRRHSRNTATLFLLFSQKEKKKRQESEIYIYIYIIN